MCSRLFALQSLIDVNEVTFERQIKRVIAPLKSQTTPSIALESSIHITRTTKSNPASIRGTIIPLGNPNHKTPRIPVNNIAIRKLISAIIGTPNISALRANTL